MRQKRTRHLKMCTVSECLSHRKVFLWFCRFCAGRECLEIEERLSALRTSRKEENIDKVSETIPTDLCVSSMIVEKLTRIPKSVANCTFIKLFGTGKVYACFSHRPMEHQKDLGVGQCRDIQKSVSTDTEFASAIVTCEAT